MSSNKPAPHFRWYAWIVLFLVASSAATALGLRLAPYLALRAGNLPVALDIHPTPDVQIPATWKGLFASARENLVVATGKLASETLAAELDATARRGVAVVLIIPREGNADKTTGIRGWLAEQNSPVVVALDTVPFNGTTCLIDRRIAVLSSENLLATSAMEGTGGLFLSTQDPKVLAKVERLLSGQATRTTPN